MSSDDSIRKLCSRVLEADDGDFPAAIEALQAALREHLVSLKAMAVAALVRPVNPGKDFPEA
jgi:hypothetical protein